MRSIFTLLTFVSVSVLITAQNPFTKVYFNDQTSGITAHSLEKGYNNSFVFCGYTSALQGYIQSVDGDGNLLWEKLLEVNENIFPRVSMKHVAVSPDSSYVFSGFLYNSMTSKHDAFLIKTDLNGDTLWTKGLEMTGETWMSAQRVIINEDSTITALLTPIEGPNIAIATLSSDGQLLSSTKYSFPTDVFAESFVRLTDGSYCVIGRTPQKNAWFLRIAADGSVLTAKTFNGYLFKDITLHTPENAFYIVGQHIASYSISCLKTDLNGQIIWSMEDPGNGSSAVINSEQIKISPYDSTHLVALFGNESMGYISLIDTNGVASTEASPYMLTADLVTFSDGTLALMGNGPIYGIRSDVIVNPHIGLIYMDSLFYAQDCIGKAMPQWLQDVPVSANLLVNAGQTFMNVNQPPFSYTDANSQLIDNCVYYLSGIEEQSLVHIAAYPTVSDGILTIQSEEQERVDLSVCDETGKIVYQQTLAFGQTALDLSQLGSGLYFCHYQTADLRYSTQKILLNND